MKFIGKVDWKWLAIGVGLGIVIRHFVPDYLQSFPAHADPDYSGSVNPGHVTGLNPGLREGWELKNNPHYLSTLT